MGLLEKALQYKKNINDKGENTLIDRIKGPADSEVLNENNNSDEPVNLLNNINSDEETIQIPVKSEDEVNIGDDLHIIENKSPEVNSYADDDLFELPETDKILPSEKLKSQKMQQPSESTALVDTPNHEIPKDEPGFFGTADEPVLMQPPRAEPIPEILKNPVKDDEESDMPEEVSDSDARLSDIIILYEIEKDIINCDTRDNLFDVILFSIMGQIGVSSTSIMIPSGNELKWLLAESRGVEIDRSGIEFSSDEGILKKILQMKKIIDIEDFNNEEYKDDYFKYISIDARIVVPMFKGDQALGIIVLGNKITGEVYTDEDMDFIKSVAALSSRVLFNISLNDEYIKKIDAYKKQADLIHESDQLQARILSSSNIEEIQNEIKNYFFNLGIESYGIFNRFENDASYKPVIVEKEDFLLLKELDSNVKLTSKFARYVFGLGAVIDVNDFKKAEIVRDAFSDSQINKMSHLRIYPFSIAKKPWGFIALFRIRQRANIEEIDLKMSGIARYLFPYINSVRDINFKENKYIDNIEILYKRIDDEIINARSLGIPLTLVLFSIKNYKRYFNLYGYEEVKKLFESFEKIIKSRLADGDFSVRYDRHKVLIILPGKDKKFAVPLANSVRNELLSVYQQKEIQLLLTYLTAEYPEDGTNLYSLIDTID